ncbi:MAG: hypothetical protein ACKO5K_03215 [Armatimonadota bacterium]
MPAPVDSRQKRMRSAILGTGLVLVVAFSYGSGMRGQKRALETVKQERRVLRERVRLSELAMRSRDARLLQWDARRRVAMALESLDRRNFGILREQLDAAADRIDAAAKVDAADAADLGDLANILRTVDAKPGADLEATRTALRKAADTFDAALDKVAPDPANITPVSVPAPNLNDIPKLPGPEIGR